MSADLARTIRCVAAGAASASPTNLASVQRRASACGSSQALPAKHHRRKSAAKPVRFFISGPLYTVHRTSSHPGGLQIRTIRAHVIGLKAGAGLCATRRPAQGAPRRGVAATQWPGARDFGKGKETVVAYQLESFARLSKTEGTGC